MSVKNINFIRLYSRDNFSRRIYFKSHLESASVQGGQSQGCVLPAPRVVRSGTPLVATIAAVAALFVVVSDADVVVVVVVDAVVVEDDGLRFSSRRALGFLPGI